MKEYLSFKGLYKQVKFYNALMCRGQNPSVVVLKNLKYHLLFFINTKLFSLKVFKEFPFQSKIISLSKYKLNYLWHPDDYLIAWLLNYYLLIGND